MSYAPYPESLEILEIMPWYNARELMRAIVSIRKINYSIVEARQQAIEILGNLETNCPVSRNNRFPEREFYLIEGNGDWARKFQQLRSSLVYKSYDKDEKVKAPREVSSQDDSQQAFYNATTNILDQIKRRDGVFNRASFERLHGLTWTP